jgi:hypothetical protein
MAEIEEEDKLTTKLDDTEKFWNTTIEKLADKLNCSAKDVVPLQAEVISVRQQLSENIKNMSYEIFKVVSKIKVLKKQNFEWYSTKYPISVNASEKAKLVEWDLHKADHRKDILDNHIEFLRETLRNIDNLNYAIKNKITLYQMTDLE